MVRFIDVLNAEIVKTKRTWNFSLVVLFPVLVTAIIGVYFVTELLKADGAGGDNMWFSYSRWFIQFYYFFYPMLAAIISFSLSNIEHRNNGFKQIFTFPTSKFSIYFSKILLLLFWMFCSLLLAYSLLVLSGNALSLIFPRAGFQDYNINTIILVFFLRTFLTLISIISIHFFLSIYWDNFIISVGSACFLVIFGMIINNWEYSYLIPYCNLPKASANFFLAGTEVFSKDILWSLGYSILFFLGGYFVMVKKSVK